MAAPVMPSDRIHAALARESRPLPWRSSRRARYLKRALDLAIALPATAVAVPVMATVAAIVKVTSKGPIFFKQQRLGLDGETFTMWKFRTMRADNADGSSRGEGEVTREDPRLTSVGAFLRDWRIDELPQLMHVLSGRMSLVGPRPDLVGNLESYPDDLLVRFGMPPGCTAWTFTRGAFANEWLNRQQINAEYVRTWSPWLDLKVLAGTLLVLAAQRDTSPITSVGGTD